MAPGNTREADNEEFLVFGYHCKLFRDDEKALYIDSGRHLIPCMEDESAKVDRYDVRLMLSDLKPHEPPPGGYDWFQCLTAEERKIEELCDEERYLALNKDLEEEALYHEEEWKRLRTALGEGAEYNFSYDQKKEEAVEPTESAVKEEEAVEVDEPFVPPHNLHIPSDLVAPTTMKQYHVIAKTAKFLANQNPQMEIVLRARQSGNVLFEFLNYGSELNPFYKYLLRVIRSGRFLPEDINPAPEVVKKEEPQPQEEEDDSDDDGGYLHPSLFASSVNLAPPVPVPAAPPTLVVKDNPFAKLISKIQAHTAASLPPPVPPPQRPPLLLAGTGIPNPSLPSLVVPPPPPPPAVPAALPLLIKPPRDLEPIIEKTALYVARNGDAFAATLMSSGDPRLSFLHPSDVHNAYFKQKVLFMRTQGAAVVQKPAAPVLKTPAIKPEAGPLIITGTTLSFKLKKRAEEAAKLRPSTKFPVEESSSTSDEEEGEKKSTVATSASTSVTSSTPNSDVDDPMDIEEEEKVEEEGGGGELELSSLSRSDVVLEKVAGKPPDEAKLRDELLTITPKKEEKPIVENEIKQLQMDRKRRAAAFLAKLQKKDSSSGTSNLRPGMKIAAGGAKGVKKIEPEDSSAMKDEPIFEISIPEPPPKNEDVEVPEEDEKKMDFEDVSNVPLPAMNGNSSPITKDGAEKEVLNGDEEVKKDEKAEDDEIEEVFSNVEKKQRKRKSDTEDLVSERSASSSRKKKKKRKRSKDETDEEETDSGRRRRQHRKRRHSSRRRHRTKRKDSSEERSDVQAESDEEEIRRSRHRRHKHRRDDDDDEKEEEKVEKKRHHQNDRRTRRHRRHHKRRRSEKNDEEDEKSSDEGSRSDKKRKKVQKDNEEGEVTTESD